MAKRSKRYRNLVEKIDREKAYSVAEAVALLKGCKGAKFDETVELAIKIEIDQKQTDQKVRGSFSLPKGTGKTLRVVAFAEGAHAQAAKAAGAIEAGGAELVEKIQGGWLDFDVAVAHPSMMKNLGRLGRVLGPKGLMPSPKSGTVAEDIAKAVREFQAGKIEFKTDDAGNIHAAVGKISFSDEDLAANIKAFIDHIVSVRPAAIKGNYITKVSVSTTMGPGLRLAV